MAVRLFLKARFTSSLAFSHLPKSNVLMGLQDHRQLYAKATLGLDGFIKQRESTQKQMDNISAKFKEKMNEYCKDINKNMIFSEDLKNMIHLATTNEDIEVVVNMIMKFNQQNKQLRFGNYIFGPVVMRLFYLYSKPDLALQCFKAPELDGFFDQLMSYQVLLDLLYEHKKYDDVLNLVDTIKERQIEGHKYPRNVIVLAMAACYKMNTNRSYEYALNLWKELMNFGHIPMRRATTFCAALALNQGDPGIALEILTHSRNQNYTTVRNLKVAALVDTGRLEQILPILKYSITEDTPIEYKHTFNKEIIERIRVAMVKSDNSDVVTEINRTIEVIQNKGNVTDQSLDEQLCQEIQKPPILNNREFRTGNFMARKSEWRKNPNDRQFNYTRQRPGLHELL